MLGGCGRVVGYGSMGEIALREEGRWKEEDEGGSMGEEVKVREDVKGAK